MQILCEEIVHDVLRMGAAMVLEEKMAQAVVRLAAKRDILLEYVEVERSSHPPIGRKALFLQIWLRPRFLIRAVAKPVASRERYCALRMDLPQVIVPVAFERRTYTRYAEYERTQARYWALEFRLLLDEAWQIYTRPRRYNPEMIYCPLTHPIRTE